MKTLPTLALILVLAGCAAPAADRGTDEAALLRELGGLAAGAPTDCVDGGPAERLTVAAPGVLALRRGGTVWVSRLAPTCRYIEPLDTLLIESHESRYCRGDRVRGLEAGATIPGPACLIEPFTPYRPS
jgi:hypothetical protein